jgi:hypothetical protein
MAGEWIAIDLSLPEKPEFQEIMELTGLDEPYVLWWLRKMWNWASMHCADGTAKMTMTRMIRVWGANEGFWLAVAAVGWLEIDEDCGTVAVPGWDRRFSQAAKSRIQHRDRAAAQEETRGRLRGPPCAEAQAVPAPERRRGEEIEENSSSSARGFASEAWGTLRTAWNTGAGKAVRRQPWKPAGPPEHAPAVISAAGWLEAALEAIPRLASCRYFDSPVTLHQFTTEGFVTKVLGGQYDAPKTPKGAAPVDERPRAVGWTGSDAARLQATIDKQRATAGGAA